MDGVAAHDRGLAVLRREAPMHALMVLVMAASMASGTRLGMLAGAGVLLVVAVACAALSRRAGHFAAQCLDLWAMALGMLALTVSPVAGHHGAGAGGPLLYAVVVVAWGAARVALARGTSWRTASLRTASWRKAFWRADAVSAGVTAVGLALMLALH